MSVDSFLDTNVLIYAVSSSPAESGKKEKALELIQHADFGLSAQVLQEFRGCPEQGRVAEPDTLV